jgi:iron complex transport system substrate-binding protein
MKSKSYIMAAALALTFSASLTACGSKPAATEKSSSQVSKPAEPSTATEPQKIQFPLTVTDQSGANVTVPTAPQHIVSVTEGTDEIVSALVPKSKLALVTVYSSDPKYSNIIDLVQGIPQIKDPNAEQIIAAKPDLVLLASYTKQGVVDQIKQANIPVFEFNDFNSIADIEKNIGIVGQLVGNESEAKKITDSMETKLKEIAEAVKNEKKVSVLDYSSYGFVAGVNTTVNDIITHAGGTNAAHDLQGWQKVSDEQIIKLNPDVIIVDDSDSGFVEKVLANPALQTVNAVKSKSVFAIKGADLSTVSQHVVKGVADVAHALYPQVKLP